jgi:prenyltransferase beta subunit
MNRFTRALRASLAAAAMLSTLAAAPAAVLADAPSASGTAARAVAWLAAKQEADGGFSNGFSKGSDVGATADAVLAFSAAGKSLTAVRSRLGRTPLDFLSAQVAGKKLSAGLYAKIALAVKAAGQNPARFGGKDLTALILAGYNEKTGVIGDNVYSHALAMLTLARAGAAVPAKAGSALESFQGANGGWAFMGAGAPDVDTTAVAVQALIAIGRPTSTGPVGRGLGYLRSVQNADGGFPYQTPSDFGTDTNANSTALAAQAIIASGDQPESWAAAAGNPLSALVSLQQASGALAYQAIMPGDNLVATVGAIPALLRRTLGAK